jgi:hypothetical protein
MSKPILRAGLAVLAAGLLPLVGVQLAQADPVDGGTEVLCEGPVQIAPEISAKTCVSVHHINYGFNHRFWATVTVRNTSASYSVTAYPQLLIDSTVVYGNGVTIPPGSEVTAYGNTVDDPPVGAVKRARGDIYALNWSTSRYSPACLNGQYCH